MQLIALASSRAARRLTQLWMRLARSWARKWGLEFAAVLAAARRRYRGRWRAATPGWGHCAEEEELLAFMTRGAPSGRRQPDGIDIGAEAREKLLANYYGGRTDLLVEVDGRQGLVVSKGRPELRALTQQQGRDKRPFSMLGQAAAHAGCCTALMQALRGVADGQLGSPTAHVAQLAVGFPCQPCKPHRRSAVFGSLQCHQQ